MAIYLEGVWFDHVAPWVERWVRSLGTGTQFVCHVHT